MPVELRRDQMSLALPLFIKNPHHSIAKSCCMGLCASYAFADATDRPSAAIIVLERFGLGFAAGDAKHAEALLDAIRGLHPWFMVYDPPETWQRHLACWSKDSFASFRYSFQRDKSLFRANTLRRLTRVPDGCILVPYNYDLLQEALSAEWSEDQMGAFYNERDFLGRGFGLALLRDGELVAGCTTFCRHHDGYDIQVDTRPDMRNKGYATCVAAAFIQECLSMGHTPYWDAANLSSLRLAQRLGYVFNGAYLTWMLIDEETSMEDVRRKAIGK